MPSVWFEVRLPVSAEVTLFARFTVNNMRSSVVSDTHQPGTSAGSAHWPAPSASPILNTVPMGQPYSLGELFMQT